MDRPAFSRAAEGPVVRGSRAGPAWLQRLLDALLPRACALCALALSPDESVAGLCGDCAAVLPGATAPRCPGCALRGERTLCPACRLARTPPTPTLACCDYAPPADRLVLAFKYGRRLELGRAIAGSMALRLASHRQEHGLPPDAALLAVPASPARLSRRGFDQAALLAHRIAAASGLPVIAAGVRRIRDTAPQPGLARERRSANLHGAMHGTSALGGRPLILVDDVITTGATLTEAERAARAAGGEPVLRLAFARTPPPDADQSRTGADIPLSFARCSTSCSSIPKSRPTPAT